MSRAMIDPQSSLRQAGRGIKSWWRRPASQWQVRSMAGFPSVATARRGALALLLALCLAVPATAAQMRRFPSPHITPEQWQALFDEVKAKPGAQDISRPDVPG